MRLVSTALLALLLCCPVFSQTYGISTVAGGSIPANVAATSVSLLTAGVAVDSAGNVFLTWPNAVLRVDAKSGVLSLVAGSGTPGFSGDGGPAIGAQLNDPSGLAVDAAGDLYIVDYGNSRIRKVSRGVITTVAGIWTPPPSTCGNCDNMGYNPPAMAVDSAGNVYISDAYHSQILKVSNGVSTTVAGNGTQGFSGDNGPAVNAQLNQPDGIAVDSAGNLFIADTGNNRIRKVSNGVITTLAGNGANSGADSGNGGPAANAVLNYPLFVAVDSAGKVYFSEPSSYIRMVANGIVTVVAGTGTPGFSGDGGPAASAQLNQPSGVAVDSAGNLYIADNTNYRIRKVASGVISTIAGNGQEGFGGDNGPASSAQMLLAGGVALDPAGDLFLADTLNNRIRKVTNGVITTVAGNGTAGFSGDGGAATSAELSSWPYWIAADSSGNLYIADTLNNRIRKVTNGVITTVAGNGTAGFSGDGGAATSAELSSWPYWIAADSSGNLYIADTLNNRIRKVTNGVITTVAGNGTAGFSGDGSTASSAELNGPTRVAVDSAGNLYIADSGNSRIRKVSFGFFNYQIISTVVGNGTPGFSGDNGPAMSAEVGYVGGLAVDAAGNLYILDSGRVRKVSNGVITTVAGNGTEGFSGDGGPTASAGLGYPTAIAVDTGGNLYIASALYNRIRKVSNGVIATVAGNGTFGFNGDYGPATSATVSQPFGVAVDSAGRVYIEDGGDNRIRVLTPTGPSTPPLITSITNAASNLAGAIAPGEIVVLPGVGLGPAQITSAPVGSDGLYDSQWSGTSVAFNGSPAPILYTWAGQVAAVVPYEVTESSAQVTLTYQGQTSAPVTIAVAGSAPGLFTLNSTGQGQAAAVNQDGSINTALAPAPIGSFISLYATGEGQTSPAGIDGKPASDSPPAPDLPVSVTIGGVTVSNLQYAGGAPGEVAGMLQINVQIPSGVQAGGAVPVSVRIGNASSQAGVTIAVGGN